MLWTAHSVVSRGIINKSQFNKPQMSFVLTPVTSSQAVKQLTQSLSFANFHILIKEAKTNFPSTEDISPGENRKLTGSMIGRREAVSQAWRSDYRVWKFLTLPGQPQSHAPGSPPVSTWAQGTLGWTGSFPLSPEPHKPQRLMGKENRHQQYTGQ